MPCYTTCNDTTGYVWDHWVADTASTCATNEVWGHWANGYETDSCTATTTNVWVKWATCSSGTAYTTVRNVAPRPLTAEEQARADENAKKRREEEARRAAEFAVREAERVKQEEEADKRAEELLVAHLDGEQRRQYRRDRSFFTHDRRGHRYHVRRAWSGHVDRVDDGGKVLERFCIHPVTKVPLPDNQLLAKLMIETEPDAFRKTANVTRIAPDPVAAA